MSILNNATHDQLLDMEFNKADTLAYLSQPHICVRLPHLPVPDGATLYKLKHTAEFRVIKSGVTHFKAIAKDNTDVLIVPFAITDIEVWWDTHQPNESIGWQMASRFFHFNMSGLLRPRPECDKVYWSEKVTIALNNGLHVYVPNDGESKAPPYHQVATVKEFQRWWVAHS